MSWPKLEWHPGELVPRVGLDPLRGSSVTNLSRPTKRVVAFYNHRGTAEQHIKEGKNAINWTRLSCRKFRNNAVRLQLHALAYNLGSFMRTLALPKEVEHWSMTTLRDKLVKIGAKVVRHGRYVTFQLAEVAVPYGTLFGKIPFELALAPLGRLARTAKHTLGGASAEALISDYVAESWRCDLSAIEALASLKPGAEHNLVTKVVRWYFMSLGLVSFGATLSGTSLGRQCRPWQTGNWRRWRSRYLRPFHETRPYCDLRCLEYMTAGERVWVWCGKRKLLK